jgi:hypothetical protein
MMKKFNVIVKKPFLDRATGIKRKSGDKMTITEKRYLEIRRSGADYVEIVKDKQPESAPKTEIKK